MKIAVFGDSYAELPIQKYYNGWLSLMSEYGSDITNFAMPGTSIFWSYEHFIKNYKKFDYIIFCHSSPQRYPCCPNYNGHGSMLHGDIFGESPYMKEQAKYYLDFFPKHFLQFVFEQVALDIDYRCKIENKKVIQIFTTSDAQSSLLDRLTSSSFITNFYYPGSLEYITINGDSQNLVGLLGRKEKDYRTCHMNTLNNIKIANIILEMVNSPTLTNLDFRKVDNWSTIDHVVDEIYRKFL
jgi:hypothetical protein